MCSAGGVPGLGISTVTADTAVCACHAALGRKAGRLELDETPS